MNEPELAKKSTFQVSPDTHIIERRLKALTPDESVSYKELNSLVLGRKLQGKDRYILYSAIRICAREHGIIVGTVRGAGIKRLTDTEIVGIGDGAIDRIGRISRKASNQILRADYDKLPATEQAKHNERLSVLGAIHQFTRPASQKVIAAKVSECKAKLALPEVIKLFS